uniref:DSS1/SEM1 family-domain-containing protein n=1 Tax=Mesocestoides corti TaxID=53468 RepID=A0A5K3EZU9_MESCO
MDANTDNSTIHKDANEFEEFAKEEWDASEEDPTDQKVWDDEWDHAGFDNDEFTDRLRYCPRL